MKNTWYLDRCILDKNQPSPVYLQLVRAVIFAIQQNVLKGGDSMPSIRELSEHYNLSKSTLEMGYNDLRDMGIIGSFPRKGYFVSNNLETSRLKILFLLNDLSAANKAVFDAFTETIGSNASVELCVYNNDAAIFENLLQSKGCDFSHYAIVPSFVNSGKKAACKLIEGLPQQKVVLLNNNIFSETGADPNCIDNMFEVLAQCIEKLRKYDSVTLICSKRDSPQRKIIARFAAFCEKFEFAYKIKFDVRSEKIQAGEAYLVIPDDQLFLLLDKVITSGLVPGKDIGIVSFAEDEIKQFILNGLTTISIDFADVGRCAAATVLTGIDKRLVHPFRLKLRASL
jgi:DNA-binding transcriptional regulator YhcF (GntR family)